MTGDSLLSVCVTSVKNQPWLRLSFPLSFISTFKKNYEEKFLSLVAPWESALEFIHLSGLRDSTL